MLQQVSDYFSQLKERIFSQEVKGHYSQKSYKSHAFFIFLLSLINILFGILFTIIYFRLFTSTYSYNTTTQIPIYLPQGNLNFYIQFDDFYQTHLRNSRSISNKQMEGKKDVESKITEPLDYRNNIPIYPAGILPNTFLRDEFEIENLIIEVNNISWSNDIKETQYTTGEVVPPPLWGDTYNSLPDLHNNERFKNWIYTAPYFTFRKLWGRLNVPNSGIYLLKIKNTYEFGKKKVVFSETSWAGNKNYFLSLSMIISGIIGIVISIIIYQKF
ncbi:Meiotically up-regulated gene 89 protein [Nosema bombycis CQ1]|uniref:Meiotically up-regulated gene 89 protein n=2 Tax=Nosema bombycis TaxID=27978 RepID=R0M1P0_NOSB1|nr:unknown [Nosema bombycis]EOB11919.1 Meiotically up-regulated gene 89 protein [Nosema bombycis CQ1]|eukprot:EOB11919.1 Meiotically up-regulated gene 89 protein [Nosema bombycis CQ1]